jgi:hypothetical protein
MCKAVDRGMVMSDITLLEKNGDKSGEWKATEKSLTCKARKQQKLDLNNEEQLVFAILKNA